MKHPLKITQERMSKREANRIARMLGYKDAKEFAINHDIYFYRLIMYGATKQDMTKDQQSTVKRLSQIQYPLHLAVDAQGPMGIIDANGRAVVWLSDVFSPAKGFCWGPQRRPVKGEEGGAGYWPQRSALVRELLEFLNHRAEDPT